MTSLCNRISNSFLLSIFYLDFNMKPLTRLVKFWLVLNIGSVRDLVWKMCQII